MPPLALRLPTKKIAAGVALAATSFYLLMSGGNVPALRAYIMIAIMLTAVLADWLLRLRAAGTVEDGSVDAGSRPVTRR